MIVNKIFYYLLDLEYASPFINLVCLHLYIRYAKAIKLTNSNIVVSVKTEHLFNIMLRNGTFELRTVHVKEIMLHHSGWLKQDPLMSQVLNFIDVQSAIIHEEIISSKS